MNRNLNRAIEFAKEARKECCNLYENTDDLELCRDILKAIKAIDSAIKKLNVANIGFGSCE